MSVSLQTDLHGDVDARHDRVPVSVDEIESQLVRALILAAEGDPHRDGTLRMNRWQLLRVNSIKRAQQIQLAVIVSRGITQYCNLNVHEFAERIVPQSLERAIANGWT